MPAIPLYNVPIPPGLGADLEAVLESRRIASGPLVEAFEAGLARYLGAGGVVATGDGSSSLSLCLLAAGVKPGDEVVVSPMACLATTCPITAIGAVPVWCDLDPATGNPTAATCAAALTGRTRALLVYHWAGYPADLDPLRSLARSHGLALVEDAGEALGGIYRGRRLGAGDGCTVFNFYPNRQLTTLDGGAVAARDPALLDRLRWLRRYGIHQPSFRTPDGEIDPASDIPQPGLNTAMNQVAAQVGLRGLETLEARVARHQANGQFFDQHLRGAVGVRPLAVPEGSLPAYWVYTLLADDPDRLRRRLAGKGIQASRVHHRNDRYSGFPAARRPLPGVDAFAAQALGIPCGWWVDDAGRERILAEVLDASRAG